ncbi:MAG: hypothetical protein MUF31_15285 [Akkermansiaceae bacterium]|jgi:hypothetical protein|nr:hypothetical protein [Akkermansiaceae bacterium]
MGLFSKLFGNGGSRPKTASLPPGVTAREVISIAVQRARDEIGGNCATLEVTANPRLWAQIMAGTFNCSYPYREDPGLLFPALFGSDLVAHLDDFNPNGYMMISLNQADATVAADWLADYFTQVLALDLSTVQLRLHMEEL